MKAIKTAILYGFLLWIIPFIASVAIFPLKKSDPLFFQSLMTVFSTIAVVAATALYFRKIDGNLREGIFLGLVFIVMSLFFDYFFFIWGPIKMSLPDYIKEIGLNYLVYPMITISTGFLLSYKKTL